MATGTDDVSHSDALGIGWILPLDQLSKTENRIEWGAELMTHAREELTFCPVRAISFLLRFAKGFFDSGALGHIMRDAKKDLVGVRPGSGPKNVDECAIFADITINKVRDFPVARTLAEASFVLARSSG